MKKILYTLLGIGLMVASTAYAINISVPSAPAANYFLQSTTTGAYIATQTPNITSTATTTIANLNTVLNVPTDFATNGCAGNPSTKDFGACVNALVTTAKALGYSAGQVMVPNITITSAQWVTPINPGITNFIWSLDCVRGAVLIYGGTGTSTTFDMSNPTGHLVSDNYGCQYQGSSSLIAAGNANSKTTTGIGFGGGTANQAGHGAVGVNFHDNSVNGFGKDMEIASNAYMLTITHNSISGGNGGVNGALLYIDKTNNSGERNVFDGNNFTDSGNLIATSTIYISRGGTASNFFTNNSVDDAGFFIGASNGTVYIGFNHFENADSGGYHGYIPIVNESSDRSTQITLNGNEFANDGNSSNTFYTIILHGAQLYASGNHIDNYGGATVTNFSDHSNDNGVESEQICQTQVQSGGLTNLIAGSGGVAYSEALASSCATNMDNSYTIGLYPNQSNTNNIFSGSNTVATFDHTGNWTLGLSSIPSTVTIQKNLTVGSSNVGVLTISTTTNGCAQLTSGIAWSTGAACGTAITNSGTTGQFPYYAGSGTTLTATSTLFVSTSGNIGVGTTTPFGTFSVNDIAGTVPLVIGSSTATLFEVNQAGGIQVVTTQPATSTAITLNWANTPSQVEYQIGTSATTITIINATTSPQWGSTKKVWVCNPGASAGTLTWVGAEWFGGTTPTQTTTSGACDLWSFDITRATSTSVYKVAGAESANFQ